MKRQLTLAVLAIAALAAASTARAATLVAHYKLDHSGGNTTAVDETGNYDGTLVNMEVGDWVTGGKVDGALSFDGNNEVVNLPNLGFSGNVSVSFAAWIKVDAAGGNSLNIFGFGNNSNNETFSLRTNGSTELHLYFWNNDLSATVPNYYGVWTHVAAVWNSATSRRRIYFNGSEANSSVATTMPDFQNINYRLSGYNNEEFHGLIDDARIYSGVLTPAAIYQLAGGIDSGLLAHWKLDESAGANTAIDEAGNFDGTNADPTNMPGQTGKVAGAYAFVAADTDDSVDTGATILTNVPAYTMAGWVNPTTFPQGTRIGLWGQNDNCEFGFNNSDIVWWTANGGNNMTVAYPHPEGEWHHITVVATTGSKKIYVDGGEIASNTNFNGASGNSGFDFKIGGGGIHDGSGNWFDGLIDEVRVYGRALSAAEVLAVYELGWADVSVTALDASAAEHPTSPDVATFEVTRVGATGSDLTVNFTVTTAGGHATEGTDYQSIGTSVVIQAGQATAVVTVTPIDDLVLEGDETVEITLQAGNYQLGSPVTASATIIDDDLPLASIDADDDASAVESGDTAYFTVTLSEVAPYDITVAFTVSGAASRDTPDDYDLSDPTDASITEPGGLTLMIPTGELTRTILVTPVQDAEGEGDEDVIVTLVGGAGYTVSPSFDWAAVVIHDDEPQVDLAATVAAASEPNVDGQFVISLTDWTGAPMTRAVSVDVTRSGSTAEDGLDYQSLSAVPDFAVVFGASDSAKTLDVLVIDDLWAESSETVTLTLQPGSGYYLGAQSADTVTISDDEPTVSIVAPDTDAKEEGADTAEFTISRTFGATPVTSGDLDVSYTVGGDASAGDYVEVLSGSVTILNTQSEITITITPVDDNRGEPDEPLDLTIVPAGGTPTYHIGAADVATITIEDNEPHATVTASDPALAEPGKDTGEFTVTLTPAPAAPIPVTYVVSGSATSGEDYVPLSGIVTVQTSGSGTIPVTAKDDRRFDAGEAIVVTLTGDTGYYVVSPSSAAMTIGDDELPGIGGGTGCSPTVDGNGSAGWSVLIVVLLLGRSALASRRKRMPRRLIL